MLDLINNAASAIEARTLELISSKPLHERYTLMLFKKLADAGPGRVDDAGVIALLNSCRQILNCIVEYSNQDIDNADNFVGLQINKLLYVDNDVLARFADDISIANLKKIITEEKIIDVANHDLDDREFVSRECPICRNSECEIIKNNISNYYVCTNCWMPLANAPVIN